MSKRDLEEASRQKWKHKELSKRIPWTGPVLAPPPSDWTGKQWEKAPDRSLQSPLQALLDVAPTEDEKEQRQRALDDADNKYLDEQLRKLPLLAQHYGFDAPRESWVGIAERNDLWVLNLVLVLAQQLVPGFMLDVGERRGARVWDETAQAGLIADVEAVKARRGCGDSEACNILVSSAQYKGRYGQSSKKQKMSSQKRAESLITRLGEARSSGSLIAQLLASDKGGLITDSVISLYAYVQSDRDAAEGRVDAAEGRVDAHMNALAQETARPEAQATTEQKRPRPAE